MNSEHRTKQNLSTPSDCEILLQQEQIVLSLLTVPSIPVKLYTLKSIHYYIFLINLFIPAGKTDNYVAR